MQEPQNKILAQYNFDPADIIDGNFEALYTQRRRDSFFAFAYANGSRYYALRDHLGGIPLYYRQTDNGIRFSTNLSDLVSGSDTLDSVGIETYLRFGTTRLYPLSDSIGIVPPGTVLEFTSGRRPRTVYQYVINPPSLSQTSSMRDLVDELDRLMRRAVERVLAHDPVGLYLSGGIDSALIGLYLHELGVRVNAYTSAPWGKISSETPFARTNASAIQAVTHFLVELESDQYNALFEDLPEIYGSPHGTTTALGVASIWRNTPIADEKQIFFGQNSDTVTCTVPAQYLTLLTNYLPPFFRKWIHPAFKHDNLIDRYLALGHKRLPRQPIFTVPKSTKKITSLHLLTMAGMYLAHTPSDSEVLTQPAILRNRLVSNPYFDMDVVEYLMAIPVRHRITLSRKSPLYLMLEKRILQQLALRYLPRELVFRKKGFMVSLDRDDTAKRFLNALPKQVRGIRANTTEERFAAGVLSKWIERRASILD